MDDGRDILPRQHASGPFVATTEAEDTLRQNPGHGCIGIAEQIDKALGAPGARDRHLVTGNRLAVLSEDAEEGVVETLRLALLVMRIPPVLGEGGREVLGMNCLSTHQ